MKAWRLERLGGELSLKDVPMPEPRPGSVLVRIEASVLMSYLKPYIEGKLPVYNPPPGPFTLGTNGVGVVEAVGRDVWHLKPGQRVVLSSHFVARENVEDPAQILIGLTSGAGAEPVLADWPDGTLAEYALMPVEAVTPVDGLDHLDATHLAAVSRCVVPYGGLLRGRLAVGETLVVNGATGAYGTAAVLLGIAMGAARVIAAGRKPAALEAVAHAGGPRVSTVALTGDVQADAGTLRAASGGGAHMAFDMVGQAGDPNSQLHTRGTSQPASRRQARADGEHDDRPAGPLHRGDAEQLGNYRPVHVSGGCLSTVARLVTRRPARHQPDPPARVSARGAAGSHGSRGLGRQSRLCRDAAVAPYQKSSAPSVRNVSASCGEIGRLINSPVGEGCRNHFR
ncbi:MAG TPA: alcohol dehydrogenase catalytic domain-containing protein [Stellaceae bacterium]|nr:alcohol dehydrogenase catalytic domain-containing protein [Stellaceae bacterium]